MPQRNFWKIIAITEFIIIILMASFFAWNSLKSDQQLAFYPDKVNKKYGRCRPTLPVDTNFVKVNVSLKGKSLAISEFEWNDSDYVSRPGCFRPNADQTEYTMSNFIYHAYKDTLAPFYIKIRSRANDNDYEFSVKVFNRKNELIGKYPETGETLKAKVDFIGIPVILMENIKLKN